MPFLVDIRDVVFRNEVFDSQFKKLQSPVVCIYTGAEDWEGMTDHLRNNQMLFATEDKSPAIRILDRRFNKSFRREIAIPASDYQQGLSH